MLASEELKKTETMLFDRENKEYEQESNQKTIKTDTLHLKRTNFEKENEVNCKREECERKEIQLNEEDERLRRLEDELEDELSCTNYCISELKKKMGDLENQY